METKICQKNSSTKDTTSFQSSELERERIEEQWRKDREHLEMLNNWEGVE
jgi:hypothetical protein